MLTSTQLFLVPYILGKASQKQPWDSLFCLVISKWRPVLHLVSRESSYPWPSGPGRWQCLSYSLISGMLCNPAPLRLIYPLLHFRRPAYKLLTDHLLLHNARPSFLVCVMENKLRARTEAFALFQFTQISASPWLQFCRSLAYMHSHGKA